MSVAVRSRHVLMPTGVLRHAAMAELLEAFFGVIEEGAHEIWLDLSAVTELHHAALDAVCRIAAFSHELDRRTLVVCPPGTVRTALSAAGVDQDLEVYDSLAAAQAAAWPSAA